MHQNQLEFESFILHDKIFQALFDSWGLLNVVNIRVVDIPILDTITLTINVTTSAFGKSSIFPRKDLYSRDRRLTFCKIVLMFKFSMSTLKECTFLLHAFHHALQ